MARPNDIAKVVLAVAVFVVAGMLGLSIADEAIGMSTGTQTVTNESVTAQYDTPVDLDGYNVVSGTVTVYNASGGVVPASDYTVNLEPGTLNVSSSSTAVSDGESISVTYDYEASDDLTTFLAGFLPVMIAVLIFVRVAEPIRRMT